MISCDWIRFLFQSIPYDEHVFLPDEIESKFLSDGLHTLRNTLRDFDVQPHDLPWKFYSLKNDVGAFVMGKKKIYWWIEPENAVLTTGNVDAVAFESWCRSEYDRFKAMKP